MEKSMLKGNARGRVEPASSAPPIQTVKNVAKNSSA
jgi:hypothetical protein